MELRLPTSLSLGSSVDLCQKEACRTDVPEDKMDQRRTTLETESGRQWRDEERETGLLGRRDRRKSDRCAEHDFNIRNSGLDTRRDSKWSSRWGPNDKEKENRSEKRIDVDTEDVHNNSQTVLANCFVSERESDSCDKWQEEIISLRRVCSHVDLVSAGIMELEVVNSLVYFGNADS